MLILIIDMLYLWYAAWTDFTLRNCSWNVNHKKANTRCTTVKVTIGYCTKSIRAINPSITATADCSLCMHLRAVITDSATTVSPDNRCAVGLQC